MASNLWNECSLEKEGNPSIYLLTGKTETFGNERKKIRKVEIGSANANFQEKVIMFVGETGTGKTTLINTIANYLLGIKWEDNRRFKVMPDEDERRQTSEVRGQTRWITSYTFHQTKTLPYEVTLVDTPGFGDADGRYTDSFITSQVREFFSTRGDGGIDHIDVVAFVLKASSQRLTTGQSRVFKSVLGLFGNDITHNIFLFITNAEGTYIESNDAPVKQAVRAAEIPYAGFLICDNIVLYHQKGKNQGKLAISDDQHYEAIWEAVGDKLKKFFDELQAIEPKSISLSADVLKEKRNLEIIVQALPDLITSTIVKMNQIKREQLIVERYEDQMSKNQDLYYEVEEERINEVPLEDGKTATVCTHCKRTCHFPCKKDLFIRVGGIRMCAAMRWFSNRRGCSVCDKHCDVSYHKLWPIKYEREIVTVRRKNEQIKERYDIAKQNMSDHKFVIGQLERHKEKAQEDIDKCVTRLRDSLKRLQQIALKSDPSSLLRVLQAMKEKEARELQPGWDERVRKLDEIYKSEEQRMIIDLLKVAYTVAYFIKL